MQDEHKTKEQLVIELSAEIMLGKTDYNLFPAAIADQYVSAEGKHFDPEIAEAFERVRETFEDIQMNLAHADPRE